MISHPTNSPPKHNDTFDKQGGDSTSNEYYHLTEEQLDILEHVTGKHNDLNEIQGGSVGEYYHLTSREHTVVENTSGVNTGSFGEIIKNTSDDLKRALGLMHENFYIDNPIYDENNNLVSARVRIHSVNTSVGTDNDVIGTYLITSNSIGTGKFTSWSQIVI